MTTDPTVGVVLVDHGSRREESNAMLLEVAAMFAQSSPYTIIEPAHMELAEPTLQTAFDRCIARGAEQIVVHPYFLLPGNHSREDIPRLAAEAAARRPDVPYVVTEPLGLHPLLGQVIRDRIAAALAENS
ncbi:CbiX/SirB N-terminal domain-containing protein [Lignipirellula cremea]|uniref:Sirohydrochlorin cobaltochelatase n=1 Tax=Lignipirellula cremea TaxID=2528010 RepID=A0A518DNN6_9BACT|nr:CbiX/SirB N-terminal domain-containing protein [Lignipirellula cremea]QDU93446.1 Sirohydrochlorin cobaltochelatase [Lignipirellula cremea]